MDVTNNISPISFFIDGYFCPILLLYLLREIFCKFVLQSLERIIFDRFNLISDKSNRFSEREREREGILLDGKRRSVNYRSKEEKLDAILGTITLPPLCG